MSGRIVTTWVGRGRDGDEPGSTNVGTGRWNRERAAIIAAFSFDAARARPGDGALGFATLSTLFVAATFGLAQLHYLTGYHLGPTRASVLIAAALACGAIGAASFAGRRAIGMAAGLIATISTAAWASRWVVDISYDGQDYHYSAIWALVDGWNPFYTSFYNHIAPSSDAEIWAPFFPKAIWIYNALWVSAGLSYEAAKTQTIVLAVAVFASVIGAGARAGWSRGMTIAVAALATANPILIAELFSRMNDGVIAALTTLFMVYGAVAIAWRDARAAAVALAIVILAISVKQSSMLIFAVLGGGLCVIAWIANGLRWAAIGGGVLMATALFAILGVGADPYLRNLVKQGNVAYPMRGAPHIVINDEYRPPALATLSDPLRLAWSAVGQTGYDGPHWKLPFTLTHDEFAMAGDPEVFLGGMGPWFSGVALLALIGTAALAATRPAMRSVPVLIAIGGLTAAAASFAMPESWSMRYVPHLWLWPLSVALAMIVAGRTSWLAFAILGAMAVNASITAASVIVRQGENSIAINRQLDRLATAGGHYAVDPGASPARLGLLLDRGIDATPSEGLPADCTGAEPMAMAHAYEDDGRRPGMICQLRDAK